MGFDILEPEQKPSGFDILEPESKVIGPPPRILPAISTPPDTEVAPTIPIPTVQPVLPLVLNAQPQDVPRNADELASKNFEETQKAFPLSKAQYPKGSSMGATPLAVPIVAAQALSSFGKLLVGAISDIGVGIGDTSRAGGSENYQAAAKQITDAEQGKPISPLPVTLEEKILPTPLRISAKVADNFVEGIPQFALPIGVLPKLAQRLAGVAFTAYAISQVPNAAKQLIEQYQLPPKERDQDAIDNGWADLITNSGFGALGAAGSVHNIAAENPRLGKLLTKTIVENYPPAQLREIFSNVTTGKGTPEEQNLYRLITSSVESPGAAIKSGVSVSDTTPRLKQDWLNKYLGVETTPTRALSVNGQAAAQPAPPTRALSLPPPQPPEPPIESPSVQPQPIDAGKNLPDWAREAMVRAGLDPARHLNDVDIQNPSVVSAIQSDPTLNEEQKSQILKIGSTKSVAPSPIETIQKVSAMSPSELIAAFPMGENNLTDSAYRLGRSLKKPEELAALQQAQASAKGFHKQFFNEAYGAATGTGSAGFALSKLPDYKPPFPITKSEPISSKLVVEPIDAPAIKQRLFENMQGRTMDIAVSDFQTPDAHLKLVLGANAPSWKQLADAGAITATPKGKKFVSVKVNVEPVATPAAAVAPEKLTQPVKTESVKPTSVKPENDNLARVVARYKELLPANIPESVSQKNGKALHDVIQNGVYHDIVHPENKVSRQIFEEFTGKKLASTVTGTKANFKGQPMWKTGEKPAAAIKPSLQMPTVKESLPVQPPKTEVKSPIANLSEAEKAEFDAIEKELFKKFQQVSIGFDPEIALLSARLANLYAKGGIKTFDQFASNVKERMPGVWEKIKVYLRHAWNQIAELLGLDEVSKADAEVIFTNIEKSTTLPKESNERPFTQETPAVPSSGGGGAIPQRPVGREIGLRGGSSPESGASGVVPNRDQRDLRGVPASTDVSPDKNYVITESDHLGEGGLKTKVADNLKAIKLVKLLESENRTPTNQEKSVLVRYVGWGGLKGVFSESKQFAAEYRELKDLLTPEEYAAARASIQDAHFTSQTIIQRGIYTAMKRLGFTGGEMVEGGVGIGNFIGLMPAEWRANSSYIGVERDPLTAKIAQYLYPEATIYTQGYQEANLQREHFDGAVGNPPFGNKAIYDKNFKQSSKHTIHNYFIGKTLELTRPGGVNAFVVSRYFLDAADPTAREYIASLGEFLGAIRLPNTAFKENANTVVVTDLVFFKRVPKGAKTDMEWTKTVDFKNPVGANSWKLNKYIAEHPEMVLGDITQATSGLYREDEMTVNPKSGQDLGTELDRSVQNLPQGVYEVNSDATSARLTTPEYISDVPDGVKVDSYYIRNGTLLKRMPDVNGQRSGVKVLMKETTSDRVKSIIPIRDALNRLVNSELNVDSTDAVIETERAALNKAYDSFVKRYGFLNSLANRRAFYDDAQSTRVLGLERDYSSGVSTATEKLKGIESAAPKANKADIFTKRVNAPYREVTHVGTTKEALSVSLNQRGGVDLDYMASLVGKNHFELIKELGDLIFQTGANAYESREKYLSGNVRIKLKDAQEAVAQGATDWQKNVDALTAVIPKDIEPTDIIAPIGAPWISAEDVSKFAEELTGSPPRVVLYLKANSGWAFEHFDRSTASTQKWGTPRVPFGEMFKILLNGKPVIVYDTVDNPDGGEMRVVNQQETELANAKVSELKDKWQEWVWADRDRRVRLARIYNDTYNNYVDLKADGSHLTLPGASPIIQLNPHQKNVAWRTIINGGEGVLQDAVVGSGKTFASIVSMMELRRLGRVLKWLVAVPNHLTEQWKDQFNILYPNANLLVARSSDFTKENRQKLFSKALTGDYDAVVLPHSSLKKIGTSPEVEKELLQEILKEIVDTIKQMKDAQGGGRGSRQTAAMEKTKDTIDAKLSKLADISGRDKVAGFEELGFDGLVVDEAHEFKNLFYTTQMQNVAGMGVPAGSAKAFDLFLKIRYLRKRFGGKAPIVFLTGTPISNSLVEMFTMQRYLQPQVLDEMGLKTLDAWAKVFADIRPVYEVDPTGTGYRMATRLANFQNVGELTAIYRNMADVITMNDLQAQAENKGGRFPVPKVTGGKPEIFVSERTPAQANYFGVETQVLDSEDKPVFDTEGNPVMSYPEGTILYRIDNMPDDPRVDNMLKLTNDARKAGLDMRLIYPNASDLPTSKINVAVNEIIKIYRKWDSQKGTQLVFCDLSVPASARGRSTKIAKSVGVLDITDSPQAEKTVIADDADDTGAEHGVSVDELLADQSSFSVYDDMRAKLIKAGIPEKQIAFIHDYDTPEKKGKLFQKVNEGDIRVLFGSTAKMGAGTNVQRRIVALHHMDAPWRPSDLEQREGRAIRQGNLFYQQAMKKYAVPQDYDKDPESFSVAIKRYATALTYDTRMWQLIEHKAAGIEGFRKADRSTRKIDDIGGEAANASDMKAAASGDPLIQQELQLRNEAQKLALLKKAWDRNRIELQNREHYLADYEKRYKSKVDEFDARKKILVENTPVDDKGKEVFKFTMPSGVVADEKGVPLGYVTDMLKEGKRGYFGKYRGYDFSFEPSIMETLSGTVKGVGFYVGKNDFVYAKRVTSFIGDEKLTGGGLFQRFDNYLDVRDSDYESAQQLRDREKGLLEEVKQEVAKVFPKQKELDQFRTEHEKVRTQLMDKRRKKVAQQNPTATAKADELASKLEDLKTGIGEGGQLHAFGILADLWDRAVSVAQGIIRAGGKFADAIAAAIKYIRDNHKGQFDEAGVTAELEKTVSEEPPKSPEPIEPPAPELPPRAQVGGIPEIGQRRSNESISEVQSVVREKGFDSREAPSPENTSKAWQILEAMTDPQRRGASAQAFKNTFGGTDMSLGLLQGELRNYALKLAASGDRSLFLSLLNHSKDFETLTGGGDTAAGRALRAAREFATTPMMSALEEAMTNERDRAAALGLKLTEDNFSRLQRALDDLKLPTDTVKKAATKAIETVTGEPSELTYEQAMRRAANLKTTSGLADEIKQTPLRAQNDPKWRMEVAERWFRQAGLSDEQASQAADIFGKEFDAAFADAAEKVAVAELKGANPTTTDDVIKALRARLLDPDSNWADEFAEKTGWKKPTDEQFKKLVELDAKLADESLSAAEKVAIHSQMMRIVWQFGKREGQFMRGMAERFVASLLSGIRTFTVQFAPAIQAARDLAIGSIADPKNALDFARSIWNSARANIISESKYAWQNDAYKFHLGELDLAHSQLDRIWQEASDDYKTGTPLQKAWARTRQLYAINRFVFKVLNTIDNTMMATTREWKLAYYGSIAFKEAGLSDSKVSDLVDLMASARQASYERAIAAGLDPLTAKVRANDEVVQAAKDFIANRTGGTLANDVMEAAEKDIYSTVGRRADEVSEKDEGLLSRLFPNDFMAFLSKMRQEGGAKSLLATALFGFVNIPYRTIRFASTFHPYGFLRYGINAWRENRGLDKLWKQSFANDTQARARLREAIAGTVLMAIATAWAVYHNSSDDKAGTEDAGLYITGNGANNKVLKDAWRKRGFRPYAMNFVFGGHIVSIPLTRVGEMIMFPFLIAAAQDDAAWKQKERAATGQPPLGKVGLYTGQIVGTALAMMGQKGIFQTIGNLTQSVQGGDSFVKAASKLGASVASATAIPLKQLLASLSDMFVGKLDQSSATALIAANFPIVGLPWQQKAINRFGDPIGDRSWYGRIADTGVPVAFQMTQTPANEKLYTTLVEKGIAPPELRRYIVEEKYGQLTDAQFHDFAVSSGADLKQQATANSARLDSMTPEAAKKFLTSAATKADTQAAAGLGLIRQVTPSGQLAGATSPQRPALRQIAPSKRGSALRPVRASLLKPKYAKLHRIPHKRLSALRGRRGSLFGTIRKHSAYA